MSAGAGAGAMTFGVVLAARTGSSRLPGKALLPLGDGVPMVAFVIRRLRASRRAAGMVLATTTLPADDRLAALAAAEGIPVFRGADADVVARFVEAARTLGTSHVVRVTGDCPFTGADTLDYCLDACARLAPFDLASTKTSFPVGIDYEIYPAARMEELHTRAPLSVADREHLTKYIYDHPETYAVKTIEARPAWKWSGRPFTVDYPADYELARAIAAKFPTVQFGIDDVLRAARELGADRPVDHKV